MKTKHHPLRTILLSLLILLLLVLVVFVGFYFTRLQTIQSIEQITDYDDGYNLYRMNVQYDYSLDRVIAYGITDNQTMLDAILKEALPLLPVSMKVPNYGCTAFTLTDTDGSVHMGRNYDFKRDTSAMLVYCAPKDGYRSVAFAALDNVGANIPDESLKKKLATLTAPFICLDGMNEKGVDKATGKVLIEVSPDFYRPTDVVNLWGDPTKARQELGWNPTKTSFEELVKIMVEHDMEKVAVERAEENIRCNLEEYLEKGVVK